MRVSLFTAARPVIIFVLLVTAVLLIPCVVVPWWYDISKDIKRELDLNLGKFHAGLASEIENIAKLLQSFNSSATNLARILSASLNRSGKLTPPGLNQVAPALFEVFSTVPYISQIQYIGEGGPSLAYYYDGNQTFAMYTNTTSTSSLSSGVKFPWYKKLVDPNTGVPYGIATESNFSTGADASWIEKALNSTQGYASLESGCNSAQDPLFLNTVRMPAGKGVISLGFPVKAFASFLDGIDLYGGRLSLSTLSGKVLVAGFPETQMIVTGESVSFKSVNSTDAQTSNVACIANEDNQIASSLKIGEQEYQVYCSPLEIFGVKAVYALAFLQNKLANSVQADTKVALILLIAMVIAIAICVLSFVCFMVRSAGREVHLCATLIKQKEATQQAERKSMSKSLAFASASHDIRASLGGIKGLIGLCSDFSIHQDERGPGSELRKNLLEENLQLMRGCTEDLEELLNSILDTSKIEAGKMQLEEKEFDLAYFLEEVVDLFYAAGMRKGLEVVLDPDISINKFSNVKGDRGRLKQIMSNLLSNAVKFTNEGDVTVRAWAAGPRFENQIIASNRINDGLWKRISCLFYRSKEDYEAVNEVKGDPNSMEFVFEVDDTGKGIPKEKRDKVFENFVQVKNEDLDVQGTGLGLGIVQSLVRLMGGEIRIVDKPNGERGTCFRFNVFLAAMETPLDIHDGRNDTEIGRISHSDDETHPYPGQTIKTPPPGLVSCTPSPKLSLLSPSPKVEPSRVVLLIQNEARRRAAQKFMESKGTKVMVLDQWERLHPTLVCVKSRLHHTFSDLSSRTESSGSRTKDVPLSSMDGTDQVPPQRSGTILRVLGFVLVIVDTRAGPFEELYRVVDDFKEGLPGSCFKVVWLNPQKDVTIDPSDEIMLQPLHGNSRLNEVIGFLPEFGGSSSSKQKKESATLQAGKASEYPGSSSTQQAESTCWRDANENTSQSPYQTQSRTWSIERSALRHSEIQEEQENPIHGKKFLVVDDTAFHRHIVASQLRKRSATVEECKNGLEAVKLVRKGLEQARVKDGAPSSTVLPDYILMDVEMPVMNGYEATKAIRKVEQEYGSHIPIIASTGHDAGAEIKKIYEAGVDAHIGKGRFQDLMEIIRSRGI